MSAYAPRCYSRQQLSYADLVQHAGYTRYTRAEQVPHGTINEDRKPMHADVHPLPGCRLSVNYRHVS